MVDNWMLHDADFLTKAEIPAKRLAQIIGQNMGARIGDSTVVSQKLHTYHPNKPQEIQIVCNADAGQVFYHRQIPGQVYHLDIFHECGLVDQTKVAKALRQAINAYNFNYAMANMLVFNSERHSVNPDAIDIQTGAGGGRITGSLNYGQKLSLRKAHENHVHISAMISEQHLVSLFYMVRAVEDVIQASQLELRRNERIVHTSGGTGKADMSAYSDHSDSFLQQKNINQMGSAVRKHQFIQDAVDLTDDFDTLEDAKDFLQEIDGKTTSSRLVRRLEQKGCSEKVMSRLSGMGIIETHDGKPQLTQYGAEFASFLTRNMPEVEAHLRQVLRLLKPVDKQAGHCPQPIPSLAGYSWHVLHTMQNDDHQSGELAISETVTAAARRMVEEKSNCLAISAKDLQYQSHRRNKKADICLLIDASASMSGQRIMAAKFLARHLLLSTPDRIGVITFQENTAQVQVQLTRDYRVVEKSLHEIRAFGSTPLSLGLKASLKYLKEVKAHNPLVILITDGIPTLADTTKDPLADALLAAGDIKREGIGFTCIGLQPHKNYLTQLAENAGGTMYVVEELEKQILVKAAWQERNAR